MKSVFYYDYGICSLGIAEENGASDGRKSICRVFFSGKERSAADLTGDFKTVETPLIRKAAAQLDEYFKGKRKTFDLPLALHGTAFQTRVWEALQNIPYGQTVSYGQIAAAAGNPKACRAAGMANNRNPVTIIIPCHRVIGSDGSLTGYAGGLELKQKLLLLERRQPLPVLGGQRDQGKKQAESQSAGKHRERGCKSKNKNKPNAERI